jgi:hypothetical protein
MSTDLARARGICQYAPPPRIAAAAFAIPLTSSLLFTSPRTNPPHAVEQEYASESDRTNTGSIATAAAAVPELVYVAIETQEREAE